MATEQSLDHASRCLAPHDIINNNKELRYRRGTARRAMAIQLSSCPENRSWKGLQAVYHFEGHSWSLEIKRLDAPYIIMAVLCNRGPLYFCPVISFYLLMVAPRLQQFNFFQLTLEMHKVWQRLCAIASPNNFVFCNSSCGSSVIMGTCGGGIAA